MDDSLRQYKSFVDSFTALMEHYFQVENLPGLDGIEGEAAKLLLAKLTDDERDKVNRLFRHITSTGVYQTLEYLDQFMEAGKLKLSWHGQELPLQRYGEDLATDWLARCEGEAWPDESTCPVHRELLHVEPVPIVYGLIRHPLDYYEAWKESFPLANAVIEGGCIVGHQKSQTRPYCEGCRKALAKWVRETGIIAGLPRKSESFFKRYADAAEQDVPPDTGRSK